MDEANPPEPGDVYQAFRERIKNWAREKGLSERGVGIGMAVPDLLHLLTRLIADSRVPLGNKLRLGFAAAYLLSPIELLPEIIFGPAGLLDDFAVVVWALSGLLQKEHSEIIKEHWAGSPEVLGFLQEAARFLDEKLVSGRIAQLRGVVSSLRKSLTPKPENPSN
ncbi:MAG: YkvA family protein [Bdellovibrionota bacterium]